MFEKEMYVLFAEEHVPVLSGLLWQRPLQHGGSAAVCGAMFGAYKQDTKLHWNGNVTFSGAFLLVFTAVVYVLM